MKLLRSFKFWTTLVSTLNSQLFKARNGTISLPLPVH